jgi:hypothetical protein
MSATRIAFTDRHASSGGGRGRRAGTSAAHAWLGWP